MREGVMLLFQFIPDKSTHSIIQSDLYSQCDGRKATSKLGIHPAATSFQSTLVFLSRISKYNNNNKTLQAFQIK